jgi:tellurite resistance protein
MMMMARVDEGLQRRVLKTYDEVVAADKRLKVLKEEDFKQMIRQQSCILDADEKKALKALSTMIPKKKDRSDAMAIAERIALADHEIDKEEKKLLRRIRKALDM